MRGRVVIAWACVLLLAGAAPALGQQTLIPKSDVLVEPAWIDAGGDALNMYAWIDEGFTNCLDGQWVQENSHRLGSVPQVSYRFDLALNGGGDIEEPGPGDATLRFRGFGDPNRSGVRVQIYDGAGGTAVWSVDCSFASCGFPAAGFALSSQQITIPEASVDAVATWVDAQVVIQALGVGPSGGTGLLRITCIEVDIPAPAANAAAGGFAPTYGGPYQESN